MVKRIARYLFAIFMATLAFVSAKAECATGGSYTITIHVLSGSSIEIPATGRTTSRTPTVTGMTSMADTAITMRGTSSGSEVVVASTTSDSNGNFAVEVNPNTLLDLDSITLTPYVEGVAGTSVTINVKENPTTDEQPLITSPQTGETIKGERPTVSGPGLAGQTVIIYSKAADGSIVQLGSGIVGSNRKFTVTPSKDFPGGKNLIYAVVNGVASKMVEVYLLDPYGVVYDSEMKQPIEGAVVRLQRTNDGGATWFDAVPGVDIASTDINPSTTAADGLYSFLSVNGDYRFVVTKNGYTFPSSIIPMGSPATGSHGEKFTVAGAVLNIDLPMDFSGSGLLKIQKDANKGEVSVGDIVTYTVTIKNEGASDVTNIYLEDKLPAGFKYMDGRSLLDGVSIQDPAGAIIKLFNIGTVAAGESRVLKYQVVVGSGVTFGKYENRARCVFSNGRQISNTASKTVKVIPDPIFDLGIVIGKVFWDRNENGVQDENDRTQNTEHRTQNDENTGLADVRIVTEEGSVITTDRDGKYHLAAITPGRHILRIDERTLPEGSYLTTDNAVIIDITPGILQKVNFGINGKDAGYKIQDSGLKQQTGRSTQQMTVNSTGGPAAEIGGQNAAAGKETEKESNNKAKESDFIFVVLGDLKIGHTTVSGNIEPVEQDDKFKEGFWSEGKFAYYLKGKIMGKYFITSSLDTDRKKKELFRNLDPNKYYPVYGDASTVNYDAANTQGMLYLAIEWDRSKAVWGDYNTGITDTELAQYNRTLYGGKLHYETVSTTAAGRPRTKLIIFQAQALQKTAHNEFLGTGGSLYYLKHKPIVEGSDKVVIEIRDKITGLAIGRVEQKRGSDYDISYSSGRIMFYQAISQVVESNSIISTALLNGNNLYVVVDYEFEVNDIDFSEWSYGGRVEQSLTDIIDKIRTQNTEHIRQLTTDNQSSSRFLRDIRLGGTYVKDDKDIGTYQLKGVDTTIYLGEHTRITAEYAESENQGTISFISTDGGLNFTEVSNAQASHGKAYSIKAQTNLYDKIALRGYYKKIEKGFSDSYTASGQGKESTGVELGYYLTQKTHFNVSYDTQKVLEGGNAETAPQVGARETDTVKAQLTHDMGNLRLTGEYRHIDVKQKSDTYRSETNEEGDTAALKADYDIKKDLGVFLRQQVSIKGEVNHQTTAGISAKLFGGLDVKSAETLGARGSATSISTTVRVDSKTELYGTLSSDNSEINGKQTSLAAGTRKEIMDKVNLSNESRLSSSSTERSKTNIIRLTGEPNNKWRLSGSFERGVVQSTSGAESTRNAGDIWITYENREKIKGSSKIGIRVDKGQEDKWQYLTSNTLEWKVSRNATLFSKISLSESRNTTLDRTEGQFKELVFGGAYRPINFDRLNLLAKYAYLEDEKASGQTDVSDIEEKRSHVFAAEAVYDLTHKWQIMEKVALKQSGEKVKGFDFTRTQTWLWINRLNYNLYRNWQVGAEYRILRQKQARDMKQGALIEVARYLGKNLQIGVGYNFTAFNDDLTYLDYTSQGPFIRLSAKITN